ncbi:hypothetical protein Pmar_PMAR004331 [Perkinsus marinus ATCC 50983]|uniref:Uncharacterized protein n=1 Tax=Perkinsus marinus (strain ATCC 50983 / TXsc) TaxID=423536 RepID=C5K4H4_PERM5|nr:hypothetical protein Pmar_PMAR004331 [Perkinsus marinus ATCC 50983]EER20667.1 hypothetical protein Pmar_PMAR004331 [Perkinsus marinus ATCC 50983]|eukprot:XP_002788871.1 hypothetical protein Pmar_PMAR004331 [Perkinsus marinus ATCC 50983]
MAPTTYYPDGDDEYCSGKPAGEYCGAINGHMARILVKEHVFYFNYESKVNLKNIPFHIHNCKQFEPDYSTGEMDRVAREFGLSTDQLRQALTITYSLPTDSFHLDWESNISVTMTHDICGGGNEHDHTPGYHYDTTGPDFGTTDHDFYPPTMTPHSGGDDVYCPGLPAGEYCGNINGDMARILIEEHVFYFNYKSEVDLKNVPFHLYNCEDFEPDYSSGQMDRLAREFGLTTDQLRQVLTITYSRSSDSFHLEWAPSVSMNMSHDACEPENGHDHHGY